MRTQVKLVLQEKTDRNVNQPAKGRTETQQNRQNAEIQKNPESNLARQNLAGQGAASRPGFERVRGHCKPLLRPEEFANKAPDRARVDISRAAFAIIHTNVADVLIFYRDRITRCTGVCIFRSHH
jgi:hypothetical protein